MQAILTREDSCKLTPWQNAPYSLTNWWTVLEFSARQFLWCGMALRNIRQDCVVGSYVGSGDDPIFYFAQNIDEKARDRALKKLTKIEPDFRYLGMQITADMVKDLVDHLKNRSALQNFQWLRDQIDVIEKLAFNELRKHIFFFVTSERVKFFPREDDPRLFGESVAIAFPSASYDIAESGMCLGLARTTACVFHLMRVLEIGLRAFAGVFSISADHSNWHNIIEQIQNRLEDIAKGRIKPPSWTKDDQEFYSQAASHFFVLKEAWRNYTAHVRGKYTEDEAERIFENTKAFMHKLATKLSE